MKKSSLILTIIIALLVGILVGIWGQSKLISKFSVGSQPSSQNKFEWTMDLINSRYVDSISQDSLLDAIIPDLLSKLDPHSEYIPPQNLSAVNESIEGKFDGIGVVFNMATDTAIVLNVITGGPGAKAGIEPGDRIIMVDDTLIAGIKMNQMDVVGRLRGVRDTKVKIGVKRGNNKELINFTLTRGVIPINSIEAEYMSRDSSAYVRINTFAEHTYIDAITAINRLVLDGAKSVVIDLRGNGGGLLDQCLTFANEFLSLGDGIVYVEGNHFPRREQLADGRGAFKNIDMYILIDEFSASASEIFAGAMQDNDRAIVIGRRSFGKGLVQEQVAYSDGSAARITIARYYTPLGRPVQKPYTLGDKDSYNAELIERYEGDELTTGKSNKIDSTITYTTKGGRTLYGGGGISPDVYVPVDTTVLPKYFTKLFQTNSIFSYAQTFADNHRKEINGIEDVRDLDPFFKKFPNLFNDFIEYAATKGVNRPTASEKAEAKELVETQLRAYISRNTPLQESGFYYCIAPLDGTMKQLSKIISEN